MALEFTQRFRRQVSPYNVVQSLAVLAGSNYCPALQIIGSGNLPNIDRTVCPTVIVATVLATAADGSGNISTVTDSAITNIKWMVQRGDEDSGTDIQLHADWTGDFAIGIGVDKGKLFVRKNIPASARWKIWMECDISDQRRGYTVAIPVVTDSVLLYSIADTESKYTMSLDRPNIEPYEAATDLRLIHEYLTGLGEAHTFTDDGNTYLREIHAQLYRGGSAMSDTDYTVKVYSIDAAGYRTEATPATDPCVSSISGKTVTFDLRFAERPTYQVACLVGTDEVSFKSYGWVWSGEMPTSDEGIVGASTYADGDFQTYRPKFNFRRGLLQYPTIAFELNWFYHKPEQTAMTYVGSGERQTFDLKSPDMFTNGESEIVMKMNKRSTFSFLATSTAGTDLLVDENGNCLIAN